MVLGMGRTGRGPCQRSLPWRNFLAAKPRQPITGPVGGASPRASYVEWNDPAREVSYDTFRTPDSYSNYLGTNNVKGFYGLTFSSGGFALKDADAALGRVTAYDPQANENVGGRNIYIQDVETGKYFSPAGRPARKRGLTHAETIHGLGYEVNRSTFEDAASGTKLETQQTIFIPVEDEVELNELQVKYAGETTKTFRITIMDEFGGLDASGKARNRQRVDNIEIGSIDRTKEDQTTVVYHPNYQNGPWDTICFATTYETAERVITELDEFTGPQPHYDRSTPLVLEETGAVVPEHDIYGGRAIAAREILVTLQPGETKTIRSLVGAVSMGDRKFIGSHKEGKINFADVEKMVAKYAEEGSFTQAFEELKESWAKRLFRLVVNTCSDTFNRIVNIWLINQSMITFAFSRSTSRFESGEGRGLGNRDSYQDILGYVHAAPERARQRILDLATIQFEDGGAYHNYQPKLKKGNAAVGGDFFDDPGWMHLAVYAYIAETGDFSILEEKVPFSANPNRPANEQDLSPVTIMEHLKRGLAHMYNNVGPHGLPLIGRADWNDCLNLLLLIGEGANYAEVGYQVAKLMTDPKNSKAESLMIAGLFLVAGQKFIEICEHEGDIVEAEKVRGKMAEITDAVKKHGWDGNFEGGGQWWRRAYKEDGTPIGSNLSETAKTWVESNAWLAMANVGAEEGWPRLALDSVNEHLATEHGIVLLNPAHGWFDPTTGEVTAYPPGFKENGGIFSHNNPWVAIAEIMQGTKESINLGFSYLTRISPWYFDADRLYQYKCEPHVFSQMIAGREAAPLVQGLDKNPATTVTAAWGHEGYVRHILGLQRKIAGLFLDPRLPDELISTTEPVTIGYTFREARHNIIIHNPDGVNIGVKSIKVDGQEIEGQLLPIFEEGSDHTIEVTMSEPLAEAA